MMCLRTVCGIRRVDKVRKTIKERYGWELSVRAQERFVKKAYWAYLESNRRRGRPKRRWRNEVK